MDVNAPVTRRAADLWIPLALIVVAVGLRAWHVAWGLPDFTEEAIPLERSFAMRSLATGAIDMNPHFFNYPSLAIYLHLLVQQVVWLAGSVLGAWKNAADYQLAFNLDPTPMVLTARWVGIACDALTLVAVYRIARRFAPASGVLAGVVLALSATAIVTARSIYVDSIMVCLALWAIERMLAWHAAGGRGRLFAAGALVGLAASAKYPAAALLAPLWTVVLLQDGKQGWRPAAIATGLAAVAFIVTTPYALLDMRQFLHDFAFEGHHAAEGHFGTAHRSFGFHLGNLVRDLGWVGVTALAASPFLAWRQRERRVPVLVLWLALLGFGVPISLARIDAERYVLPVIAIAAPLAAFAAVELVRLLPTRRALATCAAGILFAAMPAVAGWQSARQGASDTQVAARKWCEAHIRADELLVTEAYGPRLPDRGVIANLRTTDAYRYASPEWRGRVDHHAAYHVIALPLSVSGRVTNPCIVGGRRVDLPVASHAQAVNAIAYEPSLWTDADWFVTTGAVRSRFMADSASFPAPCHFYALLERSASVAARFVPDASTSGPEILVYHLDERTQATLRQAGAFDPLWWAAALPDDYYRAFTTANGEAPQSPRPLRGTDGEPLPWVRSLQTFYLTHVATLAANLSSALLELGRFQGAANFADANLAMLPDDVASCLNATAALARLHEWPSARTQLERTLSAVGPNAADPTLELLYSRALKHTGEAARARQVAQKLVQRLPPNDPVAVAARQDLAANE